MYVSVRQKPNKEMRELADVMTQMDLTDIYRTFHPNTKKYNLFSAPHGTFSKTDYMLGLMRLGHEAWCNFLSLT